MHSVKIQSRQYMPIIANEVVLDGDYICIQEQKQPSTYAVKKIKLQFSCTWHSYAVLMLQSNYICWMKTFVVTLGSPTMPCILLTIVCMHVHAWVIAVCVCTMSTCGSNILLLLLSLSMDSGAWLHGQDRTGHQYLWHEYQTTPQTYTWNNKQSQWLNPIITIFDTTG